MIVRTCKDWSQFDKRLAEFFKKPALDRQRFIFRGQSDARWPLRTTLDRFVLQHGVVREDAAGRLLSEFCVEAIGLGVDVPDNLTHQILLARHHGLPSPMMDWTRSPFIAAFFAFHDPAFRADPTPRDAAIWCIDLGDFFSHTDPESIEVIDDWTSIKLNPRAIEQQAVFLHVKSDIPAIELLPDPTIRKFVIPASERKNVLQRLDSMRITSRSLFRTLDSAALTATWRTENILLDADLPTQLPTDPPEERNGDPT